MKIHTKETAPEASRDAYSELSANFGWSPNVLGALAGSPVLIKSYQALGKIIGEDSAFTPAEQEIIQTTGSAHNGCDYCMAAHSTIIKMKGLLSESEFSALRSGESLADTKQEALRQFALEMFQSEGNPSAVAVEAVKEAGYQDEHILEMITHMAFETISNYAAHVVDPPLDEAFQEQVWGEEAAVACDTGG